MAQVLSADELRVIRYSIISAALLWQEQQRNFRMERSPSISSQRTQDSEGEEEEDELRCHEVLGDNSQSHPEDIYVNTCEVCGALTMWSEKLPSEFPFGNCLSDQCITRTFLEQAQKHNFQL